MTDRKIKSFHRYVTYRCGHDGVDSRENAEQIDCPRCLKTAHRPTRPETVLDYEGRMIEVDRSSMWAGTRRQRDSFELYLACR